MAFRWPAPSAAEDVEVKPRESQSVPTLVRRLAHELAALFRQELALAGAELIRSINRILAGASGVAAGGAVLFAGLLLLLAAAVLGLSQVLAPWLAALLVGFAVSVAGGIVVVVSARVLRPESLKPRRSARSLEKDKEVLGRESHEHRS